MDNVVRGKLKLKKRSGITKKKSHNSPEAAAIVKERKSELVDEIKTETSSSTGKPKKTAAELAFERKREQLLNERIMKKAEKSHKERVEDFNNYLENLTELNDIPKVSWTK